MVAKVVIGCPVRNRAWILPEYLAILEAIEHGDKEYLFLENDSTDGTKELLIEFAGKHPKHATVALHDYAHYMTIPGEGRGEYGAGGYSHLAKLRNVFLDLVRFTEADYLLSVDSDIIVPPDIFTQLLAHSNPKTIVGAVISNIPGRPLDGSLPGNFMVRNGNAYRHPLEYPLSGLMDVDVIGAVYLIPRQALEDGVRYGPHPQGEDIPFCQQAQEKGYRLCVAMDVKCDHRMIGS